MKNAVTLRERAIFFIGWLLSPLSFWNDTFVNIPVAYLFAHFTWRIFPWSFAWSVIVYYWLTNIVGIILMVVSGKYLVRTKGEIYRSVIIFIATVVVYTAILIALDHIHIIKPISPV